MATYEFTADQAPAFKTLSTLLQRIALFIFIRAATYLIITVITWTQQGFGLGIVASLLITACLVAIGVFLWRPVDNLKRVVATTGRDIEEMMTAFGELNAAFYLIRLVILVFVALIVVELVSLFMG